MNENYEAILQEAEERMSAINLTGSNIVVESKMMIAFLKAKLIEFRKVVKSNPFKDETQEIAFFKHYKPMLMWRLIYFHRIVQIESHKPPCDDMIEEYYLKRQEELKFFFDRHIAFYQYYNSGSTYRDQYYFMRGNADIAEDVATYYGDTDPEFTTGYDNLLARIIAMEMLYAYIIDKKRRLQCDSNNESKAILKKYRWTDTKVAAVELIYALHACGSINNGKIGINELVELFNTILHIDLENVYHTYIALKGRKINRTTYLDSLKKRLLMRLEEEDSK